MQLEGGEDFTSPSTKETHKTKAVYAGVLFEIFHYVPTGHPIRNELEGSGSNAPEGGDVWVFPVLPYDSLLVKLLGPLRIAGWKGRNG